MSLFSLILYGIINLTLVAVYLGKRGDFCQFPFWAGIISLGWFFPQALGGYLTRDAFPEYAYENGMFFAVICMLALWIGYVLGRSRTPAHTGWLGALFNLQRLYWVGVAFCIFGFYFQWKLWSLPEEMLAQSQWSGATVKYHFLASIFKIGFLVLWLPLLAAEKPRDPRYLLFVIPCLILLLSAVVLRGRRAEMMNVVSYLFVSLWLIRRIAIPRGFMIMGLVAGVVLVNGIGIYRNIMKDKDASLTERLSMAANADYMESSRKVVDESGAEFRNYIFYRQVYAETGLLDFGAQHWNELVFNYVPAQVFGREFKESLMIEQLEKEDPRFLAYEMYGYKHKTGTTATGYSDAYGSFGWLGFMKFLFIGGIMGVLYRYAVQGAFLGQLLYVYTLGVAMHSISHGTHRILISVWVYFFILAFPLLFWAQHRDSPLKA